MNPISSAPGDKPVLQEMPKGAVFEESRFAEAFGQVAQDMKAVSAYFGEVDDAYGKCGYT